MINFIFLLLGLTLASLLALPRRFRCNLRAAQLCLGILLIGVLYSWLNPSTASSLHAPVFHFHNVNLTLALHFDRLAQIMMTVIALLAVILYRYAYTYMASDLTQTRFLVQLCLVICSVSLLVLAANLFTAFLAWQWIGLTLYILLNHYHFDWRANTAAKKKFIINRVGDLFFLSALALTFTAPCGDDFQQLAQLPHATLIGCFVFIAIMTKSAQFPFHIWLPDTMETPTPVSALMHAGVINAGGILLFRLTPVFAQSYGLLLFAFTVGLITTFLGAALMQNQGDTKRKYAYSTMSQMGYMVMQCGLGAFATAVFHLIAHGFFKASLFLSAGDTLTYTPTARRLSVQASLLAILTTGMTLVIGVFLFSLQALHLPWLLWGFMAITLLQLNYQAQSIPSAKIRWTVHGLILVGFWFYLLLVERLHHALGLHLSLHILPNALQGLLIALLVLVEFRLLFKKHFAHPTCRSAIRFFLAKGGIERVMRRYALWPLRAVGEYGIQFCQKLPQPTVLFVLLLASVVLALALIFSGHVTPQGMTGSIVGLAAMMVCALLANRAPNSRQTWAWLVLTQSAWVFLGLTNPIPHLHIMAWFHAVSVLPVLLMLSMLMMPHKPEHTSTQATFTNKNKLSWPVIYISGGLLFLIGIPGTASFISEVTFLTDLLHQTPALGACYAFAMLLLSIAVLHALQVFVFDYKYIRFKTRQLSPGLHALCLSLLGINLLLGLHPQGLLHAISLYH